MEYVPARGDVVWVNFSPQVGHEQAGRRPGLVLSPKEYNARVGLTLVCPVTSQVKGYAFEVLIPEELSVSGVVLVDQIKSIDWKSRGVEFITRLPDDIVDEVLSRIGALLS